MRNCRVALQTLAGFVALLGAGVVHADLAFNFPEPVSPLTKEIYNLHMLTAKMATWIMVVVTAIIVYSLFKFRKSKEYEADQNFNETLFGRFGWILVPVIVLAIDLSIADPAVKALKSIEDYSEPDMTVKVIGSQWKWTYEYMDDDLRIVSSLKKLDPSDELYLRDVDNPIVLPVNKRIRFLHTATDVLHAWWVPAFAYKKDSIPGYINETWTIIEKEGTYRGQCAENCGTGHAYMPIVVKAVSQENYDAWLGEQKKAMKAAMAEASSDKTWSKEELMSRGKALYTKSCAACHQESGEGIPGVFPALKGSALVKGPAIDHMRVVVKGVPGTAMAPWGTQLNNLELAAIVTYERNSWGNDAGDLVQPVDIKAARQKSSAKKPAPAAPVPAKVVPAVVDEDKVWSKDELMAKGKTLYNKSCLACHQADGSGVPPVFPPLKGSVIATGPVAAHLDVVIKGKPETAMIAWGEQLSDLEVAAIVTYERNSWGNNAGDVVQPADVKAAR